MYSLSLILCFVFVILNIGYCYPGAKRIPCPLLKLKNGKVVSRPRTFAQFKCNKGYILAGERFSKCVQGKWDTILPTCVRPNCLKNQVLKNGNTYQSHSGAVLNFFCQSGYTLQGPKIAYCIDAQWNTHLPSCLPTNTTPSLNCDFESEDICGWSHDLNHNFDWKRMNFKTPSGHLGTGPSYDHTKGLGGNGYYMYIEATSRNVNDVARLISPIYDQKSNDSCLVFYYHMYGSGIGELIVYLKKISESSVLDDDKKIFSRKGNYGNKWLKAEAMLGILDEEFQIIFEGIRGISYVSDIAIDDVSIQNCDLPSTTTVTEEISDTTFIYDSCSNKCNETKTDDMICNCQYDCYVTSSCCPDFYAVCITDNSDSTTDIVTDTTADTMDDSTIVALTTSKFPKDISQSTQEPMLPLQTIYVTSTKENFINQVTNPTITDTRTTKSPTISNEYDGNDLLPSSGLTTTNKATNNKQTTMLTPILKPTWKPKPYTSIKPTILVPIKITSPPIFTTRRVTLPEKAKINTKPTKIPIINDIATLPDVLTTESNEIIISEVSIPSKEYPQQYPNLSDKAAPMQENPRPNNKTTVIAVLTVCFLVFGVLGFVFLVKKYSGKNCISVRRIRHGNGDSQSDVRFLTSDEILDFRLATPLIKD